MAEIDRHDKPRCFVQLVANRFEQRRKGLISPPGIDFDDILRDWPPAGLTETLPVGWSMPVI